MAKSIKKILWATDFSDEAREALSYAGKIARTYDAELVALHVVPDFSPVLYSAAPAMKGELVSRVDVIKEDMRTRLEELSRRSEIDFSVEIKEGPAAKRIVEFAEERGFDLIVLGKRGHSVVEKLFIGSVANFVLRHSRVPLLLTKKRRGAPRFKKILVPTDFSEYEEVERDYAWRLARKLDADLTLLHVLELHDHEFSPRQLDELMDAVLKRLQRRKTREKEDIQVTEEVTRAVNAATGIVDYAQTNAFDLIVISTCGPGGLERFFLGSTTERVISYSPIPVLAIPAHFYRT